MGEPARALLDARFRRRPSIGQSPRGPPPHGRRTRARRRRRVSAPRPST
ncbi:hypothetical protein QJS66_15645 [Kocuria rhizophila]|nr:hypothetical protein QJS66_15645 [Kocuria rhizophila]